MSSFTNQKFFPVRHQPACQPVCAIALQGTTKHLVGQVENTICQSGKRRVGGLLALSGGSRKIHSRQSNPAPVPSPVAPALRHQVAESSSPVSFGDSAGGHALETARAQPVALMHPGELSRKALGPRKMSLIPGPVGDTNTLPSYARLDGSYSRDPGDTRAPT